MEKAYDREIFGSCPGGIPSRSKIAPIWYVICKKEKDRQFNLDKFKSFYPMLLVNQDLKTKYNSILKGGGNNETGEGKILRILKLVNDTIND